MKKDFAYLADLFPPQQPNSCPQCGGRPYVFGIPNDDPTREVLACSLCGFLFRYPCPQCGSDSARFLEKNRKVFKFVCDHCHSCFQKVPGWLERPKDYQHKIQSYLNSPRSLKEKAAEALK